MMKKKEAPHEAGPGSLVLRPGSVHCTARLGALCTGDGCARWSSKGEGGTSEP